LRVAVSDFTFSGNTVFSSGELRAAVQPFIGKTLDFDELNEAAGRVQRYYRDRGYFLAVAYLPQQQIRAGSVEIAVLEGRLGRLELQMAPETRLREAFARGVLDAHLKPGDHITEAGLERPLLLLRDLPGIDLSSALGPSKTQFGAADLTVRVKESPRRFNGYADFDNHGNRFTGEHRLGLNLNANDLTGFGDLLSLRGFVTEEDMRFGRLAYVIPLGYYGTRVGLSYTQFEYRLEKDFAALQAHGEGDVATIYALHPVVRTRNANLLLQLALEEKNLHDRVDSTATVEDRKVTSAKGGVVGDFRDSLFSGGLNSYALTYTDGRLRLEPPGLQATDAAVGTGLRTAGEFAKLNLDVRRLQRLSDSFNLLVAYSGQAASKNLTASEKFSLGGPNGVRAYPVGEAAGDSGYLFTTELRYIVPKLTLLGGDVTASLFWDQGRVYVNEEPLPGSAAPNVRAIAGYGVGFSVGREGNFLFRANIATQAENEAAIADGAKREPRVWFQAVKWF
jgi:hemolysin activation/secretion protein